MATAIKTVIGTAASGLSPAGIGAAVPSIRTARAHRPEPRWGPEALRVKEIEEQLANLHNSLICSMNQLLDLKDLGTGVHSTRLAEWAIRVAQEMGIEESGLHDIEVAALLHDIGKIGVPDSILNKPGRLDEDEYALMKKHPEYGWAVLRILPGLELASLYILHHHERVDGKGYPGGLQGTYRRGLPPEEAIRRLNESSGTQFDPLVVRAFIPLALADMDTVFAAAGTSLSTAL